MDAATTSTIGAFPKPYGCPEWIDLNYASWSKSGDVDGESRHDNARPVDSLRRLVERGSASQ
jgi:hypothetical protein